MLLEPRKRSLSTVVLSVAAHGVLLSLFVTVAHEARVQEVLQPSTRRYINLFETAGGSHALLVMPDSVVSAGRNRTAEKTANSAVPHRKAAPKLEEKSEPTKSAGPTAQNTGTGTGPVKGGGNDAEDATPAFPIFSPKPPVRDRSLLPAAEQKVVVEVEVSPAGAVTKETLARGMGNALDQLVLDTVRSWKFQPATVNGSPVQSEAELIFPFDLRYPVVQD